MRVLANVAYKFRIYPNREQNTMFAKTFGCARLVYNKFLNRRIEQYKEDKTTVSYTTCAKEMAEMKKSDDYSFLKEVDSIALQQSLRHLDTAFCNFFKLPNNGFPRFKSKKDTKRSYSTVLVNGNISLTNNYLKLPKVGNVKVKQHRNIPLQSIRACEYCCAGFVYPTGTTYHSNPCASTRSVKFTSELELSSSL